MGQANSSELNMPRGVYVVPEDLTVGSDGKPIKGSLPKRWDTDVPDGKVKVLYSGSPGSFTSFVADKGTVAHFGREAGAGVMLASSPTQFCKRAVAKTIVVMGIVAIIAVAASRNQ